MFWRKPILSIFSLVILGAFLAGNLSATQIDDDSKKFEEREFDEELKDAAEEKKRSEKVFPDTQFSGHIAIDPSPQAGFSNINFNLPRQYSFRAGQNIPLYVAYCCLQLDFN